MKFSFRPVVALLLISSSATLLTACDYKYSPGYNKQFIAGFNNPKGYTNADINRDSINYKQTVTKPIGKGSATAIKNGSVDDQLNSAPAGDNTTSPQTASGQMGSTDQNMTPSATPKSKKRSASSSM
ncbi:hypothetical protein E4631_02730 [Hymenobacter sp. UV11]|uniref:hypothetical protein n=1 Tax=Hymenobacter sp. UV11 TaxID=1849735 RepID=UPI00105ED179|nr:hypothetical protein [Hymenobacter sp. UV11]TDN38474.1 hypothetical protein A8B98_24285 [Hymenobacter sp. UV11]TFZ67926.1 hypothetical protein E4631_02730 [Hymenobacter sp. UV11]